MCVDEELLCDIRVKIINKIDEYQDKINQEKESNSRNQFESKKKMKTMALFGELHKARKELRKNQLKAKEEFEKKQLEELKIFQKEAKLRQDELETDSNVKENEVAESEKRIKNCQQILQVCNKLLLTGTIKKQNRKKWDFFPLSVTIPRPPRPTTGHP